MSFLCFALFLFLPPVPGLPQSFTITGTVRDASNGEPLPAANIRLDGTARGTITNAHGEFILFLEAGERRLIVTFVGYRPDTLRLTVQGNIRRDVALQPVPIQLAEIVVTDEDPAMRIMRKVIENKKRWTDVLKSYELEAFTRQVIRRDTAIASITESYSTGYWQVGDTLREVVKQKRQTENIPISQNFAAVGGIINFYQDEIRLGGFRFVGPTALDAFDWYSFKLLETRSNDAGTIHVIKIISKSRIVPLFNGTISVIEGTWAVVGIEVSPNEAFIIPFINEMDLNYAQQFALYENQFWMPADIRLRGWMRIGITGISFPRIGLEQVSSIYDYKINVELPDTVFKKRRRSEIAEAAQFDSLFWAQHEVLPLTAEEQHAYRTLDSTQTLQQQFKPTGPLTFLSSDFFSALRFIDVRYNRVEGLLLGGRLSLDSLSRWLSFEGAIGYGFSDRRAKWEVGGELFLDSLRKIGIGLRLFSDLQHLPDGNSQNESSITLGALLDKSDYRDYYYSKGWSLGLNFKPKSNLSLGLRYANQDERSALTNTDFSIFSRDVPFRSNPLIQDGTVRSLTFTGHYGDRSLLEGLLPERSAGVVYEYSGTSILKSSFTFSRLLLSVDYFVPTLLKSYAFPPTLYLRFSAGTSSGSLPVQRVFSLDSRYSGYGPFGSLKGAGVKEFAGDAFAMLSVEHNFRSAPFLAIGIPFLYKNSIELLIHGTVAQAWSSSNRYRAVGNPTGRWYSEAGVGVSRILGLFRFDVTYRFLEPKNTFFTLSVARLL